ncbi:uncharacterized protein FIBRA_03336 [Fibroporia radiculosa]|uniref:FAD-binding domain-containing protein n=1 Tax=Fibroporia radiculosa TaxID=599839 RepID=J4HVX8_9APHY|nr:uncharacterized protein FIBRA_03336 [Fibroporia radiculosa]CCM01287.1 predicted protein [Fibroporia radiculosa]
MTSTSSSPVLIAGSGPCGLALALTLAKNGVKVRVIEKDSEFHLGQRGAGIQPRTLEVYNLLGVLPDVYARGLSGRKMCFYKLPGGVEPLKKFYMYPPEEPTPSVPFINLWGLGQFLAEEILRTHLKRYGCEVELSTELMSFEQHDDHVTAHIELMGPKVMIFAFPYDLRVMRGPATGIVRKQLGYTFQGETLSRQLVFGEIEMKGLSPDVYHFWGDMSTIFVMLRCVETKDLSSFIIGGNVDYERIFTDYDALIQCMRDGTHRNDIEFGKIVWKSDWRANVRMVDKFGEGRVFLAGDAAHIHSFTGGQGMNSSVQDAFNLGWKLALVEKGLASASLLSTYTEERVPVIRHMLGETTKLYHNTMSATHEAKGAEDAWTRGSQLKQLGVNYRWSSIIVDERNPHKTGEDCEPLDAYGVDGGTGLRAGDRAPDAPSLVPVNAGADAKLTSLFRTFGSTYHTILFFTPDPLNIVLALESLKAYPAELILSAIVYPKGTCNTLDVDGVDKCFVDGRAHASTAYGISALETMIVIVRPDGVIGGIVRGADGVNKYFRALPRNTRSVSCLSGPNVDVWTRMSMDNAPQRPLWIPHPPAVANPLSARCVSGAFLRQRGSVASLVDASARLLKIHDGKGFVQRDDPKIVGSEDVSERDGPDEPNQGRAGVLPLQGERPPPP